MKGPGLGGIVEVDFSTCKSCGQTLPQPTSVYRAGDVLEVLPEANDHWAGIGIVERTEYGGVVICLLMGTGKAKGQVGGFYPRELRRVSGRIFTYVEGPGSGSTKTRAHDI